MSDPAARKGNILAVDCTDLPETKSLSFYSVSSDSFPPDLTDKSGFQAVLIGTSPGHTSRSLLEKIRTSAEFANLPVLATNEQLGDHPLCDGYLQGQLEDVIETFGRRINSISIDPQMSVENQLLCYLWALPTRRLVPDADLINAQFYNYPLLDLWDPDLGVQWIADAERRGLIAPDRVIDRLRHCSGCDSPYLNYVDLCPHCQSVEIEDVRALHCFACGYVGDQEVFYRAQKLVCPKCHASLKHIGADYDRPIETHHCHGCGQRFLEPDIKSVCMACGRLNEQDDLNVRSVATYRLTPAGEEYVRNGRLPQAVPQILGEPVGQGHFFWMLQWLNETASTGSDVPYLTALTIDRKDRDRTTGTDITEQSVEDLVGVQLRSLLNAEDILTMLDTKTALILFPGNGQAKQQVFETELRKISNNAELLPFDIRTKSFALPNSDLINGPETWIREQMASEGT
jgi:Thaumarchaeal output domain 1